MTDTLKLNYREYSQEGEPLLVLHGLFGSHSNWGWHCKQLADDYRVIGVDLRNHGDSPHAQEMSYELMAADLGRLMDDLDIERAHLIGHSMGGKVAMQFALSQPGRVMKLVVVDIAPVTYSGKSDGHRSILEAMRELDTAGIESRRQAEEALSPHIEDEATRQFIMTNLVRDGDGNYSWRLNIEAIDAHYDGLRVMPGHDSAFEGPTLFVRGDFSRYVQKKHEPEILRLFPNAGVKSVMETGHWVHSEKPEVFQKIARDFLAQGAVEDK